MHLLIREESNPQYDQTIQTLVESRALIQLFKKMMKDSNLQGEVKFQHNSIQIFIGPLKNATWTHDSRMNVQEQFKIRIVQISFRLELCMCESEKLKQREKLHVHDFLHENITHYKNAWFRKKTRGEKV